MHNKNEIRAPKMERASNPTELRRRSLGLTGMCLGTALIVMEANVVNVAVPSIRADLHASPTTALWVVDAYTLVFAALLLSAGRLGDRVGARRSYLIGLLVFAFASIVCSLAPVVSILVTARAIQGLGAALIAPAPLTLITRSYTEATARTRAVAIWVSVGGIGFMIGPLLSGVMIDTLGWRSVFFLNIPIVLLIGWLILRYVEETPHQQVAFDPWGQSLAILGLTLVVWGLIESSLVGWFSPIVLIAVACGVVVLSVFIVSQRTGAREGRQVLLPPSILATRPVQAGLLGGAVYNFTLYGMLIVYTFVFQQLRHYSALQTGLAFLPLTLVATVTSTLIGGRFVSKYGPRAGLATGMTLCAAGLALLSIGGWSTPYLLVAIGFVVFACGQSLAAPSQTIAVMSFAPDEHKNMGSSALNNTRHTGGVVGVALLGTIVSVHLAMGTPVAMCVAAAACILAAIGALRFIPPHSTESL